MWQLTRLVDHMTKEAYITSQKDKTLKDQYMFMKTESCIAEFQLKLHYFRTSEARSRLIARKTFFSCLENGYIKHPVILGEVRKNAVIVDPKKGEDFIEMYGYGFIREAIMKEWKVATIFFGAVFSAAVYLYRLYNG